MTHRFSSRVRVAMAVALLSIPSAASASTTEVPSVAVVFGHHSHMESPQGEGASAVTYMNTVRRALDAVGVRYAVVSDLTVETDGLGCYDVAIFPYNFAVPEVEQEAIERYVAAGGKIVLFYAISPRVADLLGFHLGERKEGDFQTLLLRPDSLRGLPDEIAQGSWNIRPIEAPGADAEIIGEWAGPDGEPLGEPGLLVSPQGAYFGHVLTDGDTFRKGRMLLAVLGELVPHVWTEAAAGALGNATDAVDETERKVLERGDSASRRRGQSGLAKARAELAEAQGLSAQGRQADAIAAALAARETAASAYIASAPEREHELRGVWVHDGYGVPGWGWERSIRVLQEHGFNAVFANLLWAGIAHYPSEYLPVDERVAAEGDQIAECLRWCKQLGVELHVWKVNYNLANAPAGFVDKLRSEGRLQRHANGSEVLWLCPSDPRNFALERDSMLEVVREYDVAGIHFDYIRYPDGETCYCDGCRQRFSRDTDAHVEKWPDDVLAGPLASPYAQWRRDHITRLVRAVAEEARRIRPGIMVSAAVFSWPGAINWVGQDWKHWIGEELLDFVCPMNYTTDLEALERMVVGEVNIVQGRVPLYIGIGEFIISDTQDLVEQMERARRLGADGFVCFSYEHLGRTKGRLAELHSSLTAGRTPPPHRAPRAEFGFGAAAEGRLGPAYLQGARADLEVALRTESTYREPLRAAAGAVWLETTEGQSFRRLGTVSLGRTLCRAVVLDVPPGAYRVAVRGTAELSSSQSREFVIRSRPIEILPKARAESSQAAGRPDSPDVVTFARGADISLLQQMEDLGVVYTENGRAKDPLAIFRNHGFNYMRLRLFHTPSGKGAQVNDLPYTLRLAQRIKASAFKLLLNFHYSDTWADPGHQRPPAAWEGMSHEQLVDQVFEYTRNVIEQFAEHDCMPDMVQIGNEIGGGMLWDDGRLGSPAQWSKLADLVKAGARGVRAGAGEGRPVEIMVHIARGGDKRACAWFFDNLLLQGVEFDVIGLSYYPFWHGTLDGLRENLEFLSRRYGKGVMVVETGCNWGEGWDAVAGSESPDPPTPEGQSVFLEALIRTAKEAPNGRGVFYWAPEWVRDGGPWDRRALFDETGEVLPGMQAFRE